MECLSLYHRFCEVIDQHHLVDTGDRLLLAVSGGVDSVVLFHLFYRLQSELSLHLTLVHIHHGLRGDEADRDARFVSSLGDLFQTPVLIQKVDVPSFRQSSRRSPEESARILRYQQLNALIREHHANACALGHHLNDQAETILHHFIRGTGPQGLIGMRWKNGPFIRPLLHFSRSEIETYAREHSLTYVTDSTNAHLQYTRNRIRHRLIPFIEAELNPAILESLKRTGIIFYQVDEFLRHESKRAFEACIIRHQKNKIVLDIHQFFQYFNIIQIYVLYHIVDVLTDSSTMLPAWAQFRFLDLLRQPRIGAHLHIPGQITIQVDHDGLVFFRGNQEIEPQLLPLNQWISAGTWAIRATPVDRSEVESIVSTNPAVECIDSASLHQPLQVRRLQAGDRFKPIHCAGHKNVAQFLSDAKVPLHERAHIPILVDANGIVWVVGYRIDDRVKVTDQSDQLIKLEMRKEFND